MATMICNNCGGKLELLDSSGLCECAYCGVVRTVPTDIDNSILIEHCNRAEQLLYECDFDGAKREYGNAITLNHEDAEAYWGTMLCDYGIQYVEDSVSFQKKPTFNRLSYKSILENVYYKTAIEKATVVAKNRYEENAKQLDFLRKKVIEISQKELPYDVFISFKTEDSLTGAKTEDYDVATHINNNLIREGYRVFFAPETLQRGSAGNYEPKIFSAINSAKLMIVLGSKPEYFSAVWVRNEWSRYLNLMDGQDKNLIPCFSSKNMSIKEIPSEFAERNLEALDMDDRSFLIKIVDMVKSTIGEKTSPNTSEEIATIQNANAVTVDSLLKRAFMFLEDGEFDRADDFCEQVLNIDPQNAQAYLGKLMAELNVNKQENLKNCTEPFDNLNNYQKVIRFGDFSLVEELNKAIISAKSNFENIVSIRKSLSQSHSIISVGYRHTVGLKIDGTVVATGNNSNGQCNVSGWQNIVAISAGDEFTVGLKTDGTVVATGKNDEGQCNVYDWLNIVAISTGEACTVGLKADGTVVTTLQTGLYSNVVIDVDDWQDIVAISAGTSHIVGLKNDGTVVATGNNYQYQCDVSNWQNIVAISTTRYDTFGVKADGTVVATSCGKFIVQDWKNIESISGRISTDENNYINNYSIVGLKTDGTCVAEIKKEHFDAYNPIIDWQNIIAICTRLSFAVALESDGAVVTIGDNKYGQCNVSDWKLFDNIEQLQDKINEQKQRIQKLREAELQRKKTERNRLNAEKATLQQELNSLHGLFTGKRRQELEEQIAHIEEKIKKL